MNSLLSVWHHKNSLLGHYHPTFLSLQEEEAAYNLQPPLPRIYLGMHLFPETQDRLCRRILLNRTGRRYISLRPGLRGRGMLLLQSKRTMGNGATGTDSIDELLLETMLQTQNYISLGKREIYS